MAELSYREETCSLFNFVVCFIPSQMNLKHKVFYFKPKAEEYIM